MINLELNKNLIDDFNKNGFLILDKFIDSKYLDKLRDRFEPLFRGEFETGIEPDEWNWRFGKDSEDVTRQICNAWKSDKLIREFVCHKVIGECCSRLMNWKGARLIQDNALWKPPGGKTLGYHQDAAYDDWIIPQTMMTCWMSLDYSSKETGTLEYIKGSHKWNKMFAPTSFGKETKFSDLYDKMGLENIPDIDSNKDNYDIISWDVKPGDIILHHPLVLHSSSGNSSSAKRRRGLALRYVGEDVVWDGRKGTFMENEKIQKLLPPINLNDGDILTSELFPIIWQH